MKNISESLKFTDEILINNMKSDVIFLDSFLCDQNVTIISKTRSFLSGVTIRNV